ncbi:MAG: ferritin family protein [candidate division Zixibacteria bacterium]|nr:ferritin family protein [candidate division Zixibacteria bacterium]
MSDQSKAGILEPLRVALRLEEEGRRFFLEAAAQVTNLHARQTLEFLAGEEAKHIERIREFHRSVESGLTAPPIVSAESVENRIRAFNEKLASLRNEMKPLASDVEAYAMAVKFENGAADFYQQQIDNSSDPEVRAFYKWLVEEESLHFEVLNSCLLFIDDPARWFRERKS